jgi:hypothetical protein
MVGTLPIWPDPARSGSPPIKSLDVHIIYHIFSKNSKKILAIGGIREGRFPVTWILRNTIQTIASNPPDAKQHADTRGQTNRRVVFVETQVSRWSCDKYSRYKYKIFFGYFLLLILTSLERLTLGISIG